MFSKASIKRSACLFSFLGLASHAFADSPPWVTQDDKGHLHYRATSRGDQVPDFSHAGYGGGGVGLPEVAPQKAVPPSGADDSDAIQSALDAVSALPLRGSFRGAVVLQPGVFHCSKSLLISHDGVVLRGSGSSDEHGTRIEMTGPAHVCISILGARPRENAEPSPATYITDSYVPSGTHRVTVDDARGFNVGDTIGITRPVSRAWIHFMGMDTLVRNGKPETWIAPGRIVYQRVIRAIRANRIAFDLPLTDSIDAELIDPKSATIFKMQTQPRLAQCGIESLQIVSSPPTGILTTPNNGGITLDNCEDCWVRDIAIKNTVGKIAVFGGARRITLERVHAFHTATIARGAGGAADYLFRGSQILLDRSSSSGDGVFYVGTLASSCMLNVVLNSHFEGNGEIQPHMRWSTGLLVDDCALPEGGIEFLNRNIMGSGHGWAIGWAVAWNCTAKRLVMMQPPGAINWCIGCTGAAKPPVLNAGFQSYGKAVLPKSLYLAQLRDRAGIQALKNIGY